MISRFSRLSLILLATLILLAMLLIGCDSSSSNMIDGDTTDGDTAEQDGDQENIPDGDIDEADGDKEEDSPETPACDNPAQLIQPGWTPATTYKDTSYRQEYSVLLEAAPLNEGILSLAPDGDGAVYAATTQGILHVASSGEITEMESWPVVAFTSLARYGDGLLSAAKGITLYLGTPDSAPTEVDFGAEITTMKRASDDGLWVVIDSTVIAHIDPNSGQVDQDFTTQMAIQIMDVAEDDTYLWLATLTGLWRVPLSGGIFENVIPIEEFTAQALTGIEIDANGTKWLSSDNGLLQIIDTTITTLAGNDGLPVLDLKSIRMDMDGRLLLMSEQGLISYQPSGGSWDYYHTRYWIPDWDVKDAIAVSSDTLFVGTATGIGVILAKQMTLEEKAAILDDGMQTRHNRMGMYSACNLAEPGDLSQPVLRDDDNDGQWTNQYLASQIFRYLVTQDPAVKAICDEAAQAMLLLLNVSGLPGFFARSIIPPEECPARQACNPECGEWHLSDDGLYCWKGDTSSDEYVGHMYGLSLYYDYVADDEQKAAVRDAFVALHDGMMANGWMLLDLDGEVTTHGHFDPWFMDLMKDFGDSGLNSAMILGGLSATYHMSGEERFREAFYKLAIDENYADYVRQIQQINHKFHINHDSEEMSLLALFTLMRLETDPCLMALWREGLDYFWETQRPERDPEFNFMIAWLNQNDDFLLDDAVRTLKEWYLHGIRWSVTNSHRKDIVIDDELDRFGELQSTEVLPYDQKGAMRWAENPYRLDESGNGRHERMLQPWLLPYWMARYLGVIVSE